MLNQPVGQDDPILVCRARTTLCAIALSCVLETMRPLPVQPIGRAPRFLRGVSIIRGAPVPVVDVGALLGFGSEGQPTRFVALRIEARSVALAVEEVLGARPARSLSLERLPPLLGRVRPGVVALVGGMDERLLAVLQGARLVPEWAWRGIDGEAVPECPAN